MFAMMPSTCIPHMALWDANKSKANGIAENVLREDKRNNKNNGKLTLLAKAPSGQQCTTTINLRINL
jgi:hypothetical protein